MGKKVFIHVGLQKTGSSFLQQCVFPCLDGCDYFRGTDSFKKYMWTVGSGGSDKLLLSHEAHSRAHRLKPLRKAPKAGLPAGNAGCQIFLNYGPMPI